MSFIQNNLENYTVNQKFSAEVKQCFEENKKRYGAVKIHRKLNDGGIPCSIKRVQRHMQRQGLCSVVVKKYNHKANQGKVPVMCTPCQGHLVFYLPFNLDTEFY
ncbi:MAG: transposase [Lachnospiraceae bacterium]